ncbi:hypothetical protein FRC03_010970 [Tulasnella sp. 419]|nr:hypothetical protein FRC02_000287 [Tulasnella sp. 418]KAG8956080.1 hypothetical protein FRC03_010970 [Tulasnella sp. 419]
MVIQRIYVQPPSANSPTTSTDSPLRRLRIERDISSEGDAGRPSSPLDGVSLRSASTTPRTIGRLRPQHTGGSEASYSEYSRPSSPYDGIRVPSQMSVLKPSDFARKRSVFMKQPEPAHQLQQKLERRYSQLSQWPPPPEDASPNPDSSNSNTPPVLKRRSVSAQTPAAKPSLLIPKDSTVQLSSSPTATTPANVIPRRSPRVEYQFLDLNKKVQDSTAENKSLAENIKTMQLQVEALREKDLQARTALQGAEGTVSKDEFEKLKADKEKAEKELEESVKKSEDAQKALEDLNAQAAKLHSDAMVSHDPKAKQSLEQAVERLREQVEGVTKRPTAETSSKRASVSSYTSERLAPSSTRVPLNRTTRPPALRRGSDTSKDATDSVPATPATESIALPPVTQPPRTTRVVSPHLVSISQDAAPLPSKEAVAKQLQEFYETRNSISLTDPSVVDIPEVSFDSKALQSDILSLVDGFGKTGLDSGILSLDYPKYPKSPLSPPATPIKSKGKQFSLDIPDRAPSIRSKKSATSLKKKGWTSFLKVKLSGNSINEEDKQLGSSSYSSSTGSKKDGGPPKLAPISVSSSLSFSSLPQKS